MKVKGISFVELHVEKLVLLGVLCVGGFFAATQFLVQKNTLTIDQVELRASKIDEALANKARDIHAKLDEDADASVVPPDNESDRDWFDQALAASLSPSNDRLAVIPSIPPFVGVGETLEDMPVVVPTLMAMGVPWVDGGEDALLDEVVDGLPGPLANAINFANPDTNDLSWTTTAAQLDLSALREQLDIEPESDGELPIPNVWYRDRIFVLDVVLERQEMQGDGGWSAVEKIEAMYDDQAVHDDEKGVDERNWRASLRAQVEGDPDFLSVDDKEVWLNWLEDESGLHQAALIQPNFFATKGLFWSEPVLTKEEVGEEPEIAALRARIAGAERSRQKVQRQLDALENRGDEEHPGGGGGGGTLQPPGGGGGGSLQPPGSGGSGGSGGDDPPIDRGEARKERLRNQILQWGTRVDTLSEQLEALAQRLGVNLHPMVEEEAIPDLGNDESVLVWAHDPTVRIGATYRYRMTVRIYNPFFGRAAFLIPEQQDLAISPVLEVQPSDWSDPIRIQNHTRFFVTSADADEGLLGIGRAGFEVFRMYDGEWRMRDWVFNPGDPIGEVRTSMDQAGNPIDVDFRTNAWLQDVLRTPEKKGGAIGGATMARVVIVGADGSTIIRSPSVDSSDPERQELLLHVDPEIRNARGG